MKTFAIDFDGTWTADPEAFKEIAKILKLNGHRVIIVTARISGSGVVERECGAFVDRILFSGAEYKRDFCEKNGEKVNIWIDDMPGMIGPDIPIIKIGEMED